MAKSMRRKTMKKSRGSRRIKGGNLFSATVTEPQLATVNATPPATVSPPSGSKPPFSLFDTTTWRISGGKRRTNKRKTRK